MKLWIEKRNEYNTTSRKFTEEYFVMMKETNVAQKILFISDSIDDAQFMFHKIAKDIRPSSIEVIEVIEL